MNRIAIVALLLAGCSRPAAPGVDAPALAIDFDAAPGPKLVAVFSPRCATCLACAAALQRAIEADPDPALRVWVVWVPIERMDSLIGVPRAALERIHDSRVQQVWDSQFTVPKFLCTHEPTTSSACRDSAATPLWGFVGVWPLAARWGSWPDWFAFDPGEPALSALLRNRAP